MNKDDDIIILTDEVDKPPYDGSKREDPMPDGKKWDWEDLRNKQRAELNMTTDKNWLFKKAKQEDGACISVNNLEKLIVGKDGIWRESNYIIGKYIEGDEKLCEPVNPLDMIDSSIIRELITKVEKYITKKETKKSAKEAKHNALKNFFWFVAGISAVLWALYAGMINLAR